MLERNPTDVPETTDDDPRLGHWLTRQDDADEARVVIVGFPTDEGVRRNNGRTGAAAGPEALRRMLYRLTPDPLRPQAFIHFLKTMVDLGDLPPSGDLERDQQRLGDVLAPYFERGAVAIVIGGGHETSFGHFLGYAGAGLDTGILNWDAHPDVRPLRDGKGHSGSPFRQALEHSSGRCTGYTAAGLQPHSVAASHLRYLQSQEATVLWRQDLSRAVIESVYEDIHTPTFATFDLDAVDAGSAPGVSAPGTGGLAADLWLHAAYLAGRSEHITSIDVVELNPNYDADERTARLAALTVWYFLRGLAERWGTAGPPEVADRD
jgi:formiminoglutamase